MTPEFSPEFQAELLDDFYTESDEHLTNIRAQLTLLGNTLGETQTDPAVRESFLRSVHSLKGISAMIGLRAAEELTHAMEDFMRPFARSGISFQSSGLELVMAATQRLEQIISAHRLHQPMPGVADLQEKFSAASRAEDYPHPSILKSVAPLSMRAPQNAEVQLEAARARGLAPWHCTFLPSRELDQRGINVTAVRARLGKIGEIIAATPSVRPGGSMAFEFVLGLRETPEDLAAWERDGMRFQPADIPAPQPQPAPAESASLPPVPGADRSASLFIAPSHIVRVDLSRLDELMQITGELVIHRSRIEDRINQAAGDNSGLKEANLALGRSLRQMREAIMRVRLVPMAEIFTRMPFVIRDLARETGKKVRLVLEGQQTEIDKYLVERLKEPLLHLVRNAFSHGVELPDERAAAGKPAEATILLRATAAGEFVLIEISDDGRGIDAAAVSRRAVAFGISVPKHVDEVSLLNLLCTPGFSTREEADRASGRGVGMAVVYSTVRELGGSLTLENKPGHGAVFTLRLPLTLSITDTIIVSAADQICAVPQGYIDEIIQISEDQVRLIKQCEVVSYRDGLLPLVRLRTLFSSAASIRAEACVLVVRSERGVTGLVVDRVHTQREVVVRPMRDPLIQVPGIFGATELGDGRPVLILDAVAITKGIVRPPAAPASKLAQAVQAVL